MKRPAKKKAKSKLKSPNRKRVSPKSAEKVTPRYLSEGDSFRMGLHDVIKVIKMIEKHGGFAKLSRKLKREQAEVSVPADTVNLVKDFVADNGMHTNSIGKHIVNGRGTPAGGRRPRMAEAMPAGAAESAALESVSFEANDRDPNQCEFGSVERG